MSAQLQTSCECPYESDIFYVNVPLSIVILQYFPFTVSSSTVRMVASKLCNFIHVFIAGDRDHLKPFRVRNLHSPLNQYPRSVMKSGSSLYMPVSLAPPYNWSGVSKLRCTTGSITVWSGCLLNSQETRVPSLATSHRASFFMVPSGQKSMHNVCDGSSQ